MSRERRPRGEHDDGDVFGVEEFVKKIKMEDSRILAMRPATVYIRCRGQLFHLRLLPDDLARLVMSLMLSVARDAEDEMEFEKFQRLAITLQTIGWWRLYRVDGEEVRLEGGGFLMDELPWEDVYHWWMSAWLCGLLWGMGREMTGTNTVTIMVNGSYGGESKAKKRRQPKIKADE